jgi:hypothetical protein
MSWAYHCAFAIPSTFVQCLSSARIDVLIDNIPCKKLCIGSIIVQRMRSKYVSHANSVHQAPCSVKYSACSSGVSRLFHSKQHALCTAPSQRGNSRKIMNQLMTILVDRALYIPLLRALSEKSSACVTVHLLQGVALCP